MRWIAAALLALAVTTLCGCSGHQDEVIGQGPAALVFTGDGDESTYIKVSWQGNSGQWLSDDFTLLSGGRVELRLEDRLTYYISIDPTTATDAAPSATGKQNEVIVVGGEKSGG